MKLDAKFLGRSLELVLMVLAAVIGVWAFMNYFFPGLLGQGKLTLSYTLQCADRYLYGFKVKDLSLLNYALLSLVNSVGALCIMYGLWLGACVARLLSRGEIFTQAAARYCVKLRNVALFWGCFSLIEFVFIHQVLWSSMTMNKLLAGLCGVGLIHFFIFAFFAALAMLVSHGAGLQKDQDLTV